MFLTYMFTGNWNLTNFKREWLHDQLLNPLSIYVMYFLYVTFKNYQIISALIQI